MSTPLYFPIFVLIYSRIYIFSYFIFAGVILNFEHRINSEWSVEHIDFNFSMMCIFLHHKSSGLSIQKYVKTRNDVSIFNISNFSGGKEILVGAIRDNKIDHFQYIVLKSVRKKKNSHFQVEQKNKMTLRRA